MHCHKRERLCLIMVINCIKYCMKNRHYFSTHACIMVHWVKHLTSGRSRALDVTLDEGKSAKGLISWPTKNSQSHNWHFVRPCLLLTNRTLSRMHTVRFGHMRPILWILQDFTDPLQQNGSVRRFEALSCKYDFNKNQWNHHLLHLHTSPTSFLFKRSQDQNYC